MVEKTNAWMWTSISKTEERPRVSQMSVMQKYLEVLPPETLGIQMQVTASSIIENLPSLHDVKSGMPGFVTNHRKIHSLFCSNIFFTSFLA